MVLKLIIRSKLNFYLLYSVYSGGPLAKRLFCFSPAPGRCDISKVSLRPKNWFRLTYLCIFSLNLTTGIFSLTFQSVHFCFGTTVFSLEGFRGVVIAIQVVLVFDKHFVTQTSLLISCIHRTCIFSFLFLKSDEPNYCDITSSLWCFGNLLIKLLYYIISVLHRCLHEYVVYVSIA